MATEPKRWMGPAPSTCDCCGKGICDWFVDGKTKLGPWAIMCTVCFAQTGIGFGIGKGQLYQRNEQGQWPKTRG